jgi:hypothetical protein
MIHACDAAVDGSNAPLYFTVPRSEGIHASVPLL